MESLVDNMFFQFNNKQVYYEVHGEGKPILILNGIMMSTKSWAQFIEPFTDNNQLILFDFLDQGQSDKVVEQYDHSIQVDVVIALLEHLNLEKVNIYGVSYGGQIALQLALKRPDLIDRLCLFNTSDETSYWLSEVGHAWNHATHDGEAYYLTTIPIIYSPKFFNENREWMENRKKILKDVFNNRDFIDSMVRLTKSSENYNVADRVSEIDHQTLIVGCEYDFVTPYYQQELLHQKMKNSQLLFVPDSGHALMYEKPSLFVSLVLGFINNVKIDYKL